MGREFTDEEIKEMIANICVCRIAIVKAVKESGEPTGKMPCPICNTGSLIYSQAIGYNDHVHAHCTTKGCVSWME